MKCPNCGAEVKEQDLVCEVCHAELKSVGESAVENTGVAEPVAGDAADGAGEAEAGGAAADGAGEVKDAAEETVGETAADSAETGGAAEEPVAVSAAEPADVPAADPVDAPAPKKKGGKKALIAVAAVAVVGLGAFGIMKMQEKDPKDVVIDAFKSVYAEDQTYPIEEIFGFKQFQENAKTSREAGLTLKLDSCSEELVDQFAGSGFRVESKSDVENQTASVDMAAIYNNMDLVTLRMYYGDETLMMAVPELLDTVFVADLGDGLEERIKSSPTIGPALEAQGIDVAGMITYFRELSEKAEATSTADPYDLKGLWNRYKEGCTAQDNFKAAMTVEKADKAELTMDGKAVSCKGYQVHISKDSMIEFLRTSSDFFLQDEQLRQAYLENLEASAALMEMLGGSYSDLPSAEEMLGETYDEVKEQIDTIITGLDERLSDADMTVYVDSKGRLAAVKGTTGLVMGADTTGDATAVAFEAYLEGGAYLTQNARVMVTVGEGERAPLDVKLSREGSWDGKVLTAVYEVNVQDSVVVNLDSQYTVESGEYQINSQVQTEDKTQVKVAMSGIVDELEKGTTIHSNLDEFSVELPEIEFALAISGEYDLRPLASEIVAPDGDQLDVFAATEEQWSGVVLKAYFGAMNLASKLDL